MKKISSTKIKKYIKENKAEKKNFEIKLKDGEVLEVEVTPPTVDTYYGFIEGLCSDLFIEGEYKSYLFDMLLCEYMIRYFTNIDISNIELFDLFQLSISRVNSKSFVDNITSTNPLIFYRLLEDLEKEIKYRVNKSLKQSKFDEVIGTLNDALKEVVRITKTIESFENVDVKEIIDTLSKIGEIDESKIVSAILDNSPNIKD